MRKRSAITLVCGLFHIFAIRASPKAYPTSAVWNGTYELP